MLLAATGTVQLTGRISAVGGSSGNSDRDGDVTAGGAGSGGAIRIVGTHLNGDGTVDVHGPDRGFAYLATPWGARNCIGGSGSPGRIRLEAEVYRFQGSTPGTIATIGTPSTLFLETGPILKFLSVAGLPVPEAPTGINDVTIPSGTSDPINVTVGTLNVPVGTIVRVMMVPQVGPAVGVDNAPTTGTDVSASTQIALNIPSGASTLQASATYTVVASVGDALSRFAQGERVERVTLTSTLGQGNKAIWHTIAGRQFDVEPALLKLAAFAQ
jgi:hypothetical protein